MNQADLRAEYTALLNRMRNDDRVVGVLLSGSQARPGMATERSDFDVLIVTADDHVPDFAAEARRDPGFDVGVTSLSAFRQHALPGSEFTWDRYSYAYSRVELDTDGVLGVLVAERRPSASRKQPRSPRAGSTSSSTRSTAA